MIFAFVLVILFISMFVKLGMYSVWVTVLSTILKIMMLIITVFFIPILWRKVFGKNKVSASIN